MLRGLDASFPQPAITSSPVGANVTAYSEANTHAVPSYMVGAIVLAIAFGLLDVYQTYLAFQLVPGFYEMNVLSPFQDAINAGDFSGALALKIIALISLSLVALWTNRAYPADHWIQNVNRAWLTGWAGIQVAVVLFGIYSLFQYAASVTGAA